MSMCVLKIMEHNKHKEKREQFKAWMFTLWLPVDDSIQNLEIPLTEKVQYCKYALERGGESKRLHIQGYVVFSRSQDKSFAIKWSSGLLPGFDADIDPRSQSHELAKSYIGNPDFKHKDGREKGGEVLWVREIGDDSGIGSRGGRRAELSKTDNMLWSIKKALDEGCSYRKLYDDYFPYMVRWGRGIYDYYQYIRPGREQSEAVAANDNLERELIEQESRFKALIQQGVFDYLRQSEIFQNGEFHTVVEEGLLKVLNSIEKT